MKLNKENIAILHDFVKSKYVDFYDVELELVDHLASSIEEKMEAEKELSFKNALKETYQSFGLFGFSEFVEQKQNQVYRKGRSVFFKELIGFLKIPLIIITLLVGTFFYLVTMLFSGEIIFGISASAIILISIYGWVELWRFNKRMKKELTSARFGTVFLGSSVSLLNLFIMTFNTKMADSFILEDQILWPLIATAIFIALLAQIKAMKKLHGQLGKSYPEAFV